MAADYDVVRGDLGLLRSSGGDFTLATVDCVANDHGEASSATPDPQLTGEAFWFLVRSADAAGIYDSGASSQVGQRDVEIAASGVACP